MKKIIIYDCAAQSGGAVTVLRKYHSTISRDSEYESWFVTSVVDLASNDHTHLIKIPWVKKTWIHRIYCDNIYMPKLIKKLEPDEILSLQNKGIRPCGVKQTVYIHNAIPFSEHKFCLVKDPYLWLYQNIIGFLIYRSLRQVDSVIVQTKWMRDKVIEKCGIDEDKIKIQKIESNSYSTGISVRIKSSICTFFYPSAAYSFKNHKVIIDACRLLQKKGICNYHVYFTILPDDNKLAFTINQKVLSENLPISLIGIINNERMEEMYRKSILVFPSYLETVGLPLLEAQNFNTRIIASDCIYARETIGEYTNSEFFDAMNSDMLAGIFEKHIREYYCSLTNGVAIDEN